MKGTTFKELFEKQYPTSLAYEWDNVGLQVGTLHKNLTGILVTLDITLDVINEAKDTNCNLIVCHHPMIFKPIHDIPTDSYLGKMIESLIKNDIALYVAHTNFDIASAGMGKILADLLHLRDQEVLEFVTETEGLGVVGKLKQKTTFDDFIAQLKNTFEINSVRIIGSTDTSIQKVAIVGGSGSSAIPAAIQHQVDAYVTGDITYHYALDAKNIGLTVIDVGHNVEKMSLPSLVNIIKKLGIDVPVVLSATDTNPYTIV